MLFKLTLSLLFAKIFKERKRGGDIMARKVSTKKPLTVNARSHACNATKRRQKLNLQKKTINGEKVIISARDAKKIA